MEAFKPFLQRLTQPIILSFCIAWIFWNWEIVVSLLWYDANSIKQLGYDNHADYIKTHDNSMRNYGWPLIIAFIYPITLLILNSFITWVKKHEEKMFFRITDDANVPTKLYLDIQDQVDIKEKRISKFIEKESSMLGELNELKIDNQKLKDDLNIVSTEFKETKLEHDKLLLDSKNYFAQLSNIFKYSNPFYIVGKYNFELEQYDSFNEVYKILTGEFEIILLDEKKKELGIELKTKDFIIHGSIAEYIYKVEQNHIRFYANFSMDQKNVELSPKLDDLIFLYNLLGNQAVIFDQSKEFNNKAFQAEILKNGSRYTIAIFRK